jgi:AraC-like DNA-binding protein
VYAKPASDADVLVSHLQRTEIFRDYQQAFESITGLPLVLRKAGSFQPPLHGSKRLNPFCAQMKQRNKSCAACLLLQQRVEDEATHESKTLECFAGLNESAVPVRVGTKLVGYLQTGQVFLLPPTKKRFKDVMHAFGGPRFDSEMHELEVAYFQTRIVPRKQYELIVRLLTIFAEHLAAISNQLLVSAASAELPAMTKARAFIAEHYSEDMHLRDVARAVNMSAFYFCKVFKNTTHLNFTNYLARMRIEAVKQMLLTPHTRVAEAAFAAGFQSLSQFNRIFRQVAGESPSDFRGRLHSHSHPLVAPHIAVKLT